VGYEATGSVTITFKSPEAMSQAVEALRAANVDTARGVAPDATITQVLSDEFADGYVTVDGLCVNIEFGCKWRNQEQVVSTIAPFCSEVDGSFVGEDDARWYWTLDEQGSLTEGGTIEVRDHEHADLIRDRDTLAAFAAALNDTEHPVTAEEFLSTAVLTLSGRLSVAALELLSASESPSVRQAASQVMVAAAGT
jgi:hypothetical protein